MLDRDNTFTAIGILVVTTQTIERMLNFLLTYVLQDGQPLTYNRLMELDAKNRRKTLGYFIKEMKNRASFRDDIDVTLDRFLESRNSLIHRFDELPGSELNSDNDRMQLRDFLAQLLADTETLMTFCTAMAHVWARELGFPPTLSIEHYLANANDELLKKILSTAECIDTLIYSKE